jgi:hypothetical protein
MRPDRRDDPQMRRRFDVEIAARLGGPLATQHAGSSFDGGAQDRAEVRQFLEQYPRLALSNGFEERASLVSEVLGIAVVWREVENMADRLQQFRATPWTRLRVELEDLAS